MNELSRELVPRYTPTKLGCGLRRIVPVEALTGLSGHNNLIGLLNAHLMSDVSHEQTRLRACPKLGSPTSFTTIKKQLYPGEQLQS